MSAFWGSRRAGFTSSDMNAGFPESTSKGLNRLPTEPRHTWHDPCIRQHGQPSSPGSNFIQNLWSHQMTYRNIHCSQNVFKLYDIYKNYVNQHLIGFRFQTPVKTLGHKLIKNAWIHILPVSNPSSVRKNVSWGQFFLTTTIVFLSPPLLIFEGKRYKINIKKYFCFLL